MFYRLQAEHYDRVRPLFAEQAAYNVIIDGVLDSTNPGRVHVDDLTRPRSAYLETVEGTFLSGRPDQAAFNEELRAFLLTRVFAGDTVRPGDDALDLRVDEAWLGSLAAILAGKPPFASQRLHFVCRDLALTNWQARLPGGYVICFVDADLLARPGVTDRADPLNDYAIGKLIANWGSLAGYLANGFGYALLHGGLTVGWCIADCRSGDRCEIGIRVRPSYRRRGLASLLTAAMVDFCFAAGFFEVGWHCWAGNGGSIGVARRVGFALERRYTSYSRLFDDAAHARQAEAVALAESQLVHAAVQDG